MVVSKGVVACYLDHTCLYMVVSKGLVVKVTAIIYSLHGDLHRGGGGGGGGVTEVTEIRCIWWSLRGYKI